MRLLPSCILDEYYSRDVLGAINASSIFVRTWFQVSWLYDSPQCTAKAFCMAKSEVAELSSPIAEVVAEIYRYAYCWACRPAFITFAPSEKKCNMICPKMPIGLYFFFAQTLIVVEWVPEI